MGVKPSYDEAILTGLDLLCLHQLFSDSVTEIMVLPFHKLPNSQLQLENRQCVIEVTVDWELFSFNSDPNQKGAQNSVPH